MGSSLVNNDEVLALLIVFQPKRRISALILRTFVGHDRQSFSLKFYFKFLLKALPLIMWKQYGGYVAGLDKLRAESHTVSEWRLRIFLH